MSTDWYPAIRECCAHWQDAPMLQQTFDSLENSFSTDNDACIDSAKCIVEVVCQIIVDELDSPTLPVKPRESSPAFGVWVAAAVRALKLGDIRNAAFQRLISQHHRLTTTLGDLRNDAGPVSHGKDAFIEKLSRLSSPCGGPVRRCHCCIPPSSLSRNPTESSAHPRAL
jgi:hypothetical protein